MMAVSKKWTRNPKMQAAAVNLYRDTVSLPTIETIARTLGTTPQNVRWVVVNCIPEDERDMLKRLRYSRSKQGGKNPMTGKTGRAHHNFKGECDDGYGYLTCLHNGKRVFVHRLVVAQSLGLEPGDLPSSIVVHHIDGDPKNNEMHNLALCTNTGHRAIHDRETETIPGWSELSASQRKSVREYARSLSTI